MKIALLAIAAAALSGCQTVRVQGIDLAKSRPIFTTALLVGGGLLIAHELNEQDASPDKPACKTFAAIPEGKGGGTFCAIPLD